MPRLSPIALSVSFALAAAGCAAPLQKQSDQPAVQPALVVKHGVTSDGMYRLGRYLDGQARYESAIAAYRQALKRDPLLVEAYTGLGMALAAQRRYDEAIRQFQAAVVLAPYMPHLHNNLGYAYLLSGATEEAVKALERATQLDPSHEKARENLRIARAKLDNAQPLPPSATAGQPAVQPVTQRSPGLDMVEVAPRVYELRTSPKYRKIESKPLPLLPQEQPQSAPARSFKLEVSNGNGVLGLAKRTARRLATATIRIARLTNQRPFEQPTTEIQYRSGYAAEAAELAAKLAHAPRIVPSSELARGVDVRLVLGRDVQHQAVLRTGPDPRA